MSINTYIPHDHPAINAIRWELRRLECARDNQDEWTRGMMKALQNVLATIDPMTAPGAERDDRGCGIPLPAGKEDA